MIAFYKIPEHYHLRPHAFSTDELVTFDEIYLHHVDRHLTQQQTFNWNEKYSLFEVKCTQKEAELFRLIGKITIARVRMLTYCKHYGFHYHICDCDRMISKYESVIKINSDRNVQDETPYSVHEIEDDETPRPLIEQKFIVYKDEAIANQFCPIIHMDGEQLSYVTIKFGKILGKRALIDTGACGNAIPQDFYSKLKNTSDVKLGDLEEPDFSIVKLASGKKLNVVGQAQISFSLAGIPFSEKFLILPEMNSIILGNPFFKKNAIDISPKMNLLRLPELTIQMNSLTSNKTRQTQFKIQCAQKLVIKPNHQEIIKCKIEDKKEKFDFLSGVVTPLRKFEKKTGLCLITSLSTVEKGNVVSLSAINVTDHPITVTYGCPIATFEFLSSEQAEKLYPVDPQLIALAKLRIQHRG